MKQFAVISDCRQYRYELSRVWDDAGPFVLFIGLNPSTALGAPHCLVKLKSRRPGDPLYKRTDLQPIPL